MANRTVKDAKSIRGTNPQYLVEKIIRARIYDSQFWKEECFALTAELLVDKAMQLKYIGGVYGGNIKPTPFLCLVLKMLQIQPEKDIIVEFIRQEDFKYVRALGAAYMRLTGTSLDCYKYLEPLYNDYRKLRRQNRQAGGFEVVHMDELIDELLKSERVFDVILPRIQKREVLEELNQIEPRVSALEDDLDEVESEAEEEKMDEDKKEKEKRSDERKRHSPTGHSGRRRSRSPVAKQRGHSPSSKRRSKSRSRSRDRHRSRRSRSKDRDKEKREHKRTRSHSKSPSGHSNRRKHKSSKSSHKEKSRDKGSRDNYAEENALRKSLGLGPLKP